MRKYLLCAALAAVIASPAIAADMPVKAAPYNPFAYPAASGWYFGVGTVGGGGTANVNVPGVNSAALVTNEIGVAGIVGYVWGVANSPAFAACEAWGGWNNFNGSTPGFSFSGPVQFTERCIVGAPTDQIFSVFPNVFNAATFSPPPFTLPAGQSIVTSKAYVGAELTEKDVSGNVGALSNRVWTVAPAVTFGVLNVLTKGSVIDTGVAIEFDDKSVCIGGGTSGGCGKLSTTYLARVAFKW